MDQLQLLQDLEKRTRFALERAKYYASLSEERLTTRPTEGQWNVLECVAHLNQYCGFYHPQLDKQLRNASGGNGTFTSGWLGNYMVKAVSPGADKKKMKTFKKTAPIGQDLDVSVIEVFIQHQNDFLDLLALAHDHNLQPKKIKTMMPLVKLRLGDALRVQAYHNHRHIEQADQVLANLGT
ncbi:DinB family protein [Sediminicola luteus]|nr:DinB family protein [Sediminicola luteus]